MVFGIIVGLFLGILMAVGIALAIIYSIRYFNLERPSQHYGESDEKFQQRYATVKATDRKYNIIRWAGTGACIVCFLLLFFIPGSIHTVDTGEVAVVKRLGKIKEVRTSGTYFDFWVTDKYERYDAKVQTLDIVDSAYSRDAQTMDISMTVQYSINPSPADVKKIAEEYGSLDALSSRIRSVAIEKTKGVLSKHKAMNDDTDKNGIIENREEVGMEVTEAVKAALNGYYVNVNTVVLTNIDFTDAFEKIVEEKMIAEQEKLKAQYEKEKAIIKAQQDLAVAQLAADAKLYEAKQDAEAQKAIAAAEAYSTQIKIIELARSLGYTIIETPQMDKDENGKDIQVGITYEVDWSYDEDGSGKQALLNYLQYLEYLAKWNGKLPDVVAGDNLSIFVPAV